MISRRLPSGYYGVYCNDKQIKVFKKQELARKFIKENKDMNKVYIVLDCIQYEGTTLVAVFSTIENARKYIKENYTDRKETRPNYFEERYGEYTFIQEERVDKF